MRGARAAFRGVCGQAELPRASREDSVEKGRIILHFGRLPCAELGGEAAQVGHIRAENQKVEGVSEGIEPPKPPPSLTGKRLLHGAVNLLRIHESHGRAAAVYVECNS